MSVQLAEAAPGFGGRAAELLQVLVNVLLR